MGSSPNPTNYIQKPDDTLAIAQLGMQSQAGANALKNQNELLRQASTIPLESWTPDIFGEQGMMTKAGQIAAINSFKSKQLEQQQNPQAAAARLAIQKSVEQDVSPDFWKNQMNEWAKTKGLQSYLGSGLQDSTVGKSALFDLSTIAGKQFRDANLASAQSKIGSAPVAGIDPSQAIAGLQGAQLQGMQQRQGFRNALLGGAQQNAQSTTDWINQLMGSTSQAVGAHQQNWQNYQQALLSSAAQNAASQNAALGSGMQGIGQLAGTAAMMALI